MKRRAPSHSLLTFLLASCMAVATVTTAFGEGLGEPGNSTSAVNDAYADVVNSTSAVNDAYADVDNSTSAVNDAYADVDSSTSAVNDDYADVVNSTSNFGTLGNSTGGSGDAGNSTGGSGDAGNETVIGDDALISVRGYSSDLTYTGSALTFDSLKVYFSNELLNDDDYEIVYKNNVNVGKASFTITVAGESETFYFNIKPASLKNATVNGIRSKTYTGKALTQKPTVTVSGRTLKQDSDYTLSYRNNTKAGTASVIITGKGNYAGKLTKNFSIVKAANTLRVKAKSRTVNHTKVAKKNTSLPRSKVLRISKAKGKVTYAKKRGNTKITVNKKTGKVTLKKGLAKGTYKVKVKVTAAGNANYKKGSKTVTFKVIVK